MMTSNLRENDALVSALSGSLREGKTSFKQAPRLLKKILRENLWRKRVIAQTGQVVEFDRFEDFAQALPLEGLGMDIATIRQICGNDQEALRLLDQSLGIKTIGKNKSQTDKIPKKNYDENSQADKKLRAKALRKLRTSRPDLHAKVVKNLLPPAEALVEAGFFGKTIIIPLHPQKAAKLLARNFKKIGLWAELVKQVKAVR